MSDGIRHNTVVREIGYAPIDLLAAALAATGGYLLIAVGMQGAWRVATASILLWVLPGYVTLAALFPKHASATDASVATTALWRKRGLSLRERGVLTLGVSLFVLVLIGLVLGVIYTGITAELVSQTVLAYVLVVSGIAAVRRYRVSSDERFSIPLQSWYDEAMGAFSTGSVGNRALTIALACSILLAVGSLGFAVAAGPTGQSYTDFYLLTPDGEGGYASADYPETVAVGEDVTLTWGIQNAETEATDYTVVVTLERVVENGGEQRVIERQELDRTSVSVADGEEVLRDHTIQPTMIGDNLRVGYYLYRGDAPERASAETAYRHLHIWTTVTPAS